MASMPSAVIDYSSSESEFDSDTVSGDKVHANVGDDESCEELDHTARVGNKRKAQESCEVIMTDFEFFDLKPEDFHCVRSMLMNWLDGYHDIDLAAISGAISHQSALGTIAKTDSHAVALATILPLSSECMESVSRYLMDRVDTPTKQWLKSRSRIGVLIFERFLNLPWQLIPDIFDSLQKDLLWARQHSGPEYEYDSLVFIARTNPASSKHNKSGNVSYLFQEQATLASAAVQCCSFTAVAHGGGVRTRTSQRTMIGVQRSSLPDLVRQMRSVFQ